MNVKNIKRMGVKTIVYVNNNLYIQNSLSKDFSLLYKLKYQSVDSLDYLINIERKSGLYNNLVRIDSLNNGFCLKKEFSNLNSIITNVKSLSFRNKIAYPCTSINDSNIDIQIINNYNDILKIISTFLNDAIVTINTHIHNSILTSYSQNTEEFFDKMNNAFPEQRKVDKGNSLNQQYFDYIGMLLPFINIENYDFTINKAFNIDYFVNNIMKHLNDALNLQEEIYVDLVKVVKFILYQNKDVQKLSYYESKLYKVIINNFKNQFINNKTLITNIIESNFAKYYIENKLLTIDFLKTSHYLISHLYVFDYLQCFSYLRNYLYHQEGINTHSHLIEKWVTELLNHSQDDFSKYIDDFIINNSKFYNILRDVYGVEKIDSIFTVFLKYHIFDEGKNIGISLKEIFKEYRKKLNLNSRDKKEFNIKYKTLIKFDMYLTFKDKTESIIKDLKTTSDKKLVYDNLSRQYYLENNLRVKKIAYAIQSYLGYIPKNNKNQNCKPIFIYKKNLPTIKFKFLNILYTFSRILTTKEANLMFSKIIHKIQSIIDLIELALNVNYVIKPNSDYDLFLPLLISDKQTNVDTLIDLNTLKSVKQELYLIKTLRNHNSFKNTDKGISTKIFSIYNSFPSNIEFDKFIEMVNEREYKNFKPLKNFLKHDVYLNNSYQYIYRYSNPEITKLIFKNRELVRFILWHLYSENNLQTFFSEIYCKYKRIEDKNHEFVFDPLIHGETLFKGLYELKVENLMLKTKNINNKPLVKLYFYICYSFLKNIIDINKSYTIGLIDYEEKYKSFYKLAKLSNTDYNLNLTLEFIKCNSGNSKSIKQLKAIMSSDYIKNIIGNKYNYDNYIKLIRKYRNYIAHCLVLDDIQNIENIRFESVNSYFEIYQSLVQNHFSSEIVKLFDSTIISNNNYKKDGITHISNSTKVTIAMNLLFAYDMSRFNKITIAKYFVNRFKSK